MAATPFPLQLSAGGGGPSGVSAAGNNFAFDNSGWTVATGGGAATASRTQTPTVGGIPVQWYLIGALAAFIVWKKLK